MHQLVQRARNETLVPQSSKQFSTIIAVGHSLGSELTSYYMNEYADEDNIDAAILTTFSNFAVFSAIGFTIGVFATAGTLARYSALSPPCVRVSDARTVRAVFYHGSYNREFTVLDYQGFGMVGYGEFACFLLGIAVKPNVKVPVMIMNGRQDQLSCTVTPIDTLLENPGECGTGAHSLTARIRALFPKAPSVSNYNVPDTGHCISLRYPAPKASAAAQHFLDSIGF